MSTSASIHPAYFRPVSWYLAATLFCALFGFVYEQFSFGVYSAFMAYAFAIPLALGVGVFYILALHQKTYTAPAPLRACYHSGVATLTVGSIVKGVLDIYGTTNALVMWYWCVGGVLLAAGIAGIAAGLLRHHRSALR